MPQAMANGIPIEFDTFGDDSSSPLLLIMGLGAQMLLWEDDFCRMLADSGFYVIRLDNRDCGLSYKYAGDNRTTVKEAILALQNGFKIKPPYRLEDMADDALGILDHLGIESAHLCGASMGGMIAQLICLNNPSRALSLTSIMSTVENPFRLLAGFDSDIEIYTPPPNNREQYIEYMLEAWKLFSGKGFKFDEDRTRNLITREYDRSFYPEGTPRQLLAIMAAGDRTDLLKKLRVKTLVIHGEDDPLVPVRHGIKTAETIPDAELLIIPGMGHDLPPETWPLITGRIAEHALK